MSQNPDEDPKRHFIVSLLIYRFPPFCFFFTFYLFNKINWVVCPVSHNVDFADCVLRVVFNVFFHLYFP